ncbi:ANTAR domain-containing protein [Pseudonocardia xishanensis]|uniref:ANTAR domain-containing protein n=1 Tax=Pseudonocardia xishanensis TaxID=630995 RepID=A0ABP8S335_9PSEU
MDDGHFGKRFLELMLESLRAALPGCTGVGLCLSRTGEDGRSASAVGVAGPLDEAQWAAGDGPLVEAAKGDSAVVCPDLAADERWPGFPRPEGCSGLAVVAVPSSWDERGPVLLTAYVDTARGDLGPDALAVLDRYEPLLATGLGVVEYCADELVRADEMIAMMRRRQLIEQAKGMVMASAELDAEGAFALLVRASQRENVKVRDLAGGLVTRTGDAGGVPDAARGAAERLWIALHSQGA